MVGGRYEAGKYVQFFWIKAFFFFLKKMEMKNKITGRRNGWLEEE